MPFQVIIHAGAGKCGSSTIQNFLVRNAELMHEAGVAFLSSTDFTLRPQNRGVQFGGSFPLGYFAAQGAPEESARRNLLASLEACEKAGKRYALISAENALGTAPEVLGRLPLFFEDVIARFDVRLVAYVRRPDEWLISAWKQWGMKVADPRDWLAYCCLKPEPSFGAGLEAWKLALGGHEKIYCNILSSACLSGGNIIRDFVGHALADLTDAFEEVPNANMSPPAAWLNLLSENRATLFSNEHDIGLEQFLETLIAVDDGRERNVDEVLTADGRVRITQVFRQDIEHLIEGFIPDKARARKYFRLDDDPTGIGVAVPKTSAEMTEYLRDAVFPPDKAAIERAFRGVMLGAMRNIDRRLSAINSSMVRQQEVQEVKIDQLRSIADETVAALNSLRQDIEQQHMRNMRAWSDIESRLDEIISRQAELLLSQAGSVYRMPQR